MTPRTLTLTAFLVLSAAGLAAWRGAAQASGQLSARGEAPTAVSPAEDLLYARPFVLDAPYTHTWRAEEPGVLAGYLLVLDVDPAYVVPRNQLEPVLYVGSQTAERLHTGSAEGRVVALVPAPLGDNGEPLLELATTPIWFGTPELPERVDEARIALERARALDAGVAPLPVARVQAALAGPAGSTAPLLRFPDRTALERFAAERMRTFVPSEAETAESILAPLVR